MADRTLRPREPLTSALLAKARAERERGNVCQFPIEHPRGLSIHVTTKDVAFYIQARGPNSNSPVKRRIDAVSAIGFDKVKLWAGTLLTAIKNGDDVDAVLQTLRLGGDEDAVGVAVDRAAAQKQRHWTLRECVRNYIDRKEKDGSFKLKPSSRRELEDRLLNVREAQPLMDKFVRELRLDDCEKVRDELSDPSAPSNHGKFVDLLKRVLRWGLKHRRQQTGLRPETGWWEVLAHEYSPEDRSERKLSPSQVGMLLALVEAVRAVDPNTNDSVFGALQGVFLVAQRSDAWTEMAALTSNYNWVPDPAPGRKGWRVYTWEADEVKGTRQTRLSLPPLIIEIVERVAASAEAVLHARSRFAFPQITDKYRKRLAVGNSGTISLEMDKPITESSLNHLLAKLGGQKEGYLNLLGMVGLPAPIGPHDARRSVSSYFDDIGKGSLGSALLDHLVIKTDAMDREVALVTQTVYSSADRIPVKADALNEWIPLIIKEYEKAKGDPRISIAVAAQVAHVRARRREAGIRAAARRAEIAAEASRVPDDGVLGRAKPSARAPTDGAVAGGRLCAG